jgi:hypothetical protein
MPHRSFSAHFTSTAASRKELENALKLSRAAIAIAFEGLHRAETSFQSLSEIRICTEALAVKANTRSGRISNTTAVDRKRELAGWTLKGLDAYDEHENDMKDAWQGWSSAMSGAVRAKKCQVAIKEDKALLVQNVIAFQGRTKRRKIEGRKLAVENEQDKMLEELLEAAGATHDMLREVHKMLRDHEKAWEWIEQELKKGFMAARSAVSQCEWNERWTV